LREEHSTIRFKTEREIFKIEEANVIKKIGILSALILFFGLWSSQVAACNCGKKAVGEAVSSCQDHACGGCGGGQEAVCSEENVEAKGANCPVSGKPIGSMGEGVTYTYNGKTYQLCCAGCIDLFKADPEKYIKNIETDG
jgi:YHS domain-containing protein